MKTKTLNLVNEVQEKREFKLALLQLDISTDKTENIARACRKIDEAAENGAEVVSLTEAFVCPYSNSEFVRHAEKIPGLTTEALADSARKNGVFVVGGSIPERDGDKLYNTCAIFSPEGLLIAKYRKCHLSNVKVPGKVAHAESEVFSNGNELVSFDTPYCRIGVGVCYDLRFQAMARTYVNSGCEVLLYPSAFTTTIGPAHLVTLTRARALDNLCYVACCSPARNENAEFIAWGHSHVVNPWAEVIAEADEKDQILYVDVDLNKVEEVRSRISLLSEEREELYSKEVNNVGHRKEEMEFEILENEQMVVE